MPPRNALQLLLHISFQFGSVAAAGAGIAATLMKITSSAATDAMAIACAPFMIFHSISNGH
jgi:hypothetical protein